MRKKSEPKSSEASKSLAAVYFLPPTVQIVSLDLLSENHENSEIRKAKMEFQDSKPIKFTAPSVNKIGSFRADSSSTNYPPKCAPKLCTLEITTSSQGTQKEEYENQHTDNTQQETNGSSSLENVDIDVEPTKCNVAQLVGSPFSPQSATETTEQYRAQQYKDFDDLTTKDLPSIVRDLECSVRSYRGFRSPYPKK
ncbi:hypothetical protein M3Y98_01031200 [Aphelenchoides besseyi]|nr:hypothetical protein M3Y98_01031200 [Aphelenchoides besseyi]